nr:Platyhelminth-specific Rhodopsin-like Orphan Family 1 G protein-coupled receptor [Hymenolepis microstoma]
MVKFLRRRKCLLTIQGSHRRKISTGSEQSEGRTEMKRVIAYLLISFISFAFTTPFVVVICIRTGHSSDTPRCESTVVAELSRLFNSTKDIQYAIHGYTYIFFFKFFRKRLRNVGRRMREKCACLGPLLRRMKSIKGEPSQVTDFTNN